jgi:hydrogenase expression/formation protein HypE
MKTGKLDSRLLEEIVFRNIKFRRPEVLTHPGVGEDCAVVDFSAYDCVVSTDPITGAASDIGRIAIHISCNDIAASGTEPLGILMACMLPEGTTEQEIEEIMRQAGETSADLGVEIIGGHTEITSAVNRPVIVTTALGRACRGCTQSADNMRPGDYILITKEAGLEGTGILASDYEDRLVGILCEDELNVAKSMLDKISVVKEGVIAGKIGTAGMHDITEGGVLGALWEMCEVSGTGAELWLEQIPVAAVTRKICSHFGIDWLRLISSGSMMIIAHPGQKEQLIKTIGDAGISVTCIGRVKEASEGRVLVDSGRRIDIVPPGRDELYKVVAP